MAAGLIPLFLNILYETLQNMQGGWHVYVANNQPQGYVPSLQSIAPSHMWKHSLPACPIREVMFMSDNQQNSCIKVSKIPFQKTSNKQ